MSRNASLAVAALAALSLFACSTSSREPVDRRPTLFVEEPRGALPEEIEVIRENILHVARRNYSQHFNLDVQDRRDADIVLDTKVAFSIFESGVSKSKGRAWPIARAGTEGSQGSGRFISDITLTATDRRGGVLASAVYSQPLGGVEGRGNYESPGAAAQPVTRQLLNRLVEAADERARRYRDFEADEQYDRDRRDEMR